MSQERKYVILRKATPTLQASDLDVEGQLRERLKLKYSGDCKCRHCQLVPAELVSTTADLLQSLPAQLAAVTEDHDSWRRVAERLEGEKQAAEANLAAANKQIEEMRGAREQALEEAAQVADARKGPREDYGYDAGFNNACEFIARAIRARTALSHEARNG